MFARACGGRTGSWGAEVPLPRSLRASRKLRLTVRYLGESGYAPTSLNVTTRPR